MHRWILASVSASLLAVLLAPGLRAHTLVDAEDDLRYLAGLVERGLFAEAIPAGESFLRSHGRDERAPLARLYLAEALFAKDRRADALRHFETLAKTDGFEARDTARLRFAQCALEANRAEDALHAVTRIESRELRLDADRLAARAAYAAGHTEDAAKRYTKLARHESKEVRAEAELGLAWLAFDRRDWAATATHVDRALALALPPSSEREARSLGAEAALATNDARRALGLVAKADEQRADVWFVRGRAHALESRTNESLAAFERALRLGSKDEAFANRVRGERGRLLVRSGSPQEAIDDLRRAGDAWWLARAELDAGDARAAWRVLERAEMTRDASFAQLAGEILTALGRTDEAVARFASDESAEGLYSATFTAFEAGDDDRVAQLAKRLGERFADDPRSFEAWFLAGEAAFRNGRHEEAEGAFQRASRTTDDELRQKSLRRRLWCLNALGRQADIVELGRARTDDPEVALLTGLALVEAGRIEEAVRAFDAGLRSGDHPRALELTYYRGLHGSGSAAQRDLEKVAESSSDRAPDALLEFAVREEAAGRIERARSAWRQFRKRFADDPRTADASYALGWSHFDAGEFGDCLNALEGLLDSRSSKRSAAADELYLPAHELAFWAALSKSALDAADKSLRVLTVNSQPESVLSALRAFVEKAAAGGELGLARSAAKRVEARGQGFDIGARIELVWLELGAGNVERAEASFGRLKGASGPAVAEAAYALGEALLATDAHERAERAFVVAAKDPGDVGFEATYQRAYLALVAGNAKRASQLLAPLLEATANLEPELDLEVLALATRAAEDQRDHARTIAIGTRYLERHPKTAHTDLVSLAVGRALVTTDEPRRAVKLLAPLLRRKLEGRPAIEAHLLHGLALVALDRQGDARRSLAVVIDKGKVDEDLARARHALASLEEASGDREAALAAYLKVSILHVHAPSVTAALLAAARLLEASGDAAGARARLEELLKRYPESPAAAEAKAALSRL